jgi:hypothetical protein
MRPVGHRTRRLLRENEDATLVQVVISSEQFFARYFLLHAPIRSKYRPRIPARCGTTSIR